MKTKLLFSTLALVVMLSAFGQRSNVELTFSAVYNAQAVPLDSILIENITQGGDTTLYAPDTVLALYITSIDDCPANRETRFSVSQNYPNPFKDQTTINIHMPKKEKIVIHIRDILGREMTSYEEILNVGNHTFTFYPGNEKYYLLTVCGATATETIKMIVATGNTSKASSCKMVYTSYNETDVGFKSQKANGDFVYLYGDTLRYTGFALTVNDVNGSDVLEDTPLASEDYEFEITEGIPCPGIPTIAYEDQVYNTVQIGDQCWLKENLNVGTMIPRTTWMTDNGILEKYCYNNDPANCDKYGGLYQWYEMMLYSTIAGAQGICPMGWHIPTDDEWKSLEMYLGMSQSHADSVGFRGTDEAKKMKTTTGWDYNGNGTNSSGFSALPGGFHYGDGSIWGLGGSGYWWSSTEYENNTNRSWARVMTDSDKVYRYYWVKYPGYSVRCIKDD